MKRSLFAVVVSLAASLSLPAADYERVSDPKEPYTVEELRQWHSALDPWPWSFSPEQEVHLRGSSSSQLLLCFGGGARSGEFMLFQRQANGWVSVGSIGQAHHPIHVLSAAVSGWHDFQTFLPLWGSGGKEVLVLHYRWHGDSYQELSRSEGAWCDYEPFKSNRESAESCR